MPGPEVHSCRATRLLPLDGSVGEGADDDLPRQRRLGETVTQGVSGHRDQQGECPPESAAAQFTNKEAGSWVS